MKSPASRAGSPSFNCKKNCSSPLPDEHQLFERWLEEDSSPTQEELVNSSKTRNNFLTEPGFNTSDGSLSSQDFTEAEKEALRPIVWRRVTGLLVVPSPHYCRLMQGSLNRSCWFLGALAAVAAKQHLLLNLVVSDEHAPLGLYTFQFYKHGAWRQVVVDNRLPCIELQQRLAFSSSCTPQELWPSLVEKAYARLHGGYAAIATGCVGEALVDLTGGIVDTIELTAGFMSEGAVWLAIMQALSAGNLAVCTASADAQQQQPPVAAAGLLPQCPYSILAAKVLPSGLKLLQLHNPWSPQGSWQGAWGPDAAEWSYEEGEAALAADPAMEEGLQDPATFWCSFWDFMQVFSTLYLLQLPGDSWHEALAVSGWSGSLAADGMSSSPQPAASVHQAMPGATLAPAEGPPGHGAGQTLTGQHEGQQQQPRVQPQAPGKGQQHSQQQCLQVSPECLAWACRPQFKLVVGSACEVLLSLGQRDKHIITQAGSSVSFMQQQQQPPGSLQIGLRVVHTPHSSRPALQPKLLAAAGLCRPGTSLMSATVCPSSRGSSRNRSRSPRRPMTAPAAAAAADDGDAAASSVYRVWAPELHPAVADSGLCSSRDVVLRFVAQAGSSYTVMPYTRSASDTGPFVLRAWAPSPVQLEQLPSPYSLAQGSQWSGSSAGGSRASTTWASNPHLCMTCAREATALVCLQRPDVCNSLLEQPFDPHGCISITVCRPEVQTTSPGKARTPSVAATPAAAAGSKVVGSTDYSRMDRTVLLMKLQPDTPYLLVPSTAEPGVEVPFELSVLSSNPVELCELPRQCTVQHSGLWTDSTAGGSNLHSSWLHNPAFTLQLHRKALCRITLTRTAGSWRRNQSLGEMIGLSALRLPTSTAAAAAAGTLQAQEEQHLQSQRRSQSPQQYKQPSNSLAMLKQHQLQEAAFVPMQSCQVDWELPGRVPLLLVPCTYAPGVRGSFKLSVTTSGCAFSCDPVLGSLAALLAANGTRVTRPTQH